MSLLHCLDTNILLYSISRHPAKSAKRDRAIDLQEFYVRATRSIRPDPLPHEIVAGLIATWMRFRVQEITLPILTGALEIKVTHGFSYWDSTIIVAACALRCRELCTEDMTHGREVEGVIIDPSAEPRYRRLAPAGSAEANSHRGLSSPRLRRGAGPTATARVVPGSDSACRAPARQV